MCNHCALPLTLSHKQNMTAELEKRLRAERTFAPIVRALFNRQLTAFRVAVSATGLPPTPNVSGWQTALNDHYRRVRRLFRGDLRNELKTSSFLYEAKQLTPAQEIALDQSIDNILQEWAETHSGQQAQIIANTNLDQMRDAINQARQMLEEQGETVTNQSLARASFVLLRRRYFARIEPIVELETLTANENIKFTEVNQTVIAERRVSVEPVFVIKTWRTVGDSRVRESHRLANGQTVLASENFTLEGSQLAYPGDPQFSPPLNLIINCRCSAEYRRATQSQINAMRRAA